MVTEFGAQSVGIREISVSTGRQGFRKPEGFSSGHKGDNCYESVLCGLTSGQRHKAGLVQPLLQFQPELARA